MGSCKSQKEKSCFPNYPHQPTPRQHIAERDLRGSQRNAYSHFQWLVIFWTTNSLRGRGCETHKFLSLQCFPEHPCSPCICESFWSTIIIIRGAYAFFEIWQLNWFPNTYFQYLKIPSLHFVAGLKIYLPFGMSTSTSRNSLIHFFIINKCSDRSVGTWKCNFPALLGNIDRPTNQPTDWQCF